MHVISVFPLQSPRLEHGLSNWRIIYVQRNRFIFHIKSRLPLIGFSGREPEQKFTKNGTPYTALSLATKTSWRNDQDEWESRTEWHWIIAWSKLAEFALTLTKGAHLQVEGDLRSREYEKDGSKRRIWECKAYRIAKLDRVERADENGRDEEPNDDSVPFWSERIWRLVPAGRSDAAGSPCF